MACEVKRTQTRVEQRKIMRKNARWARMMTGKRQGKQKKESMGEEEQKKEGVKKRWGIEALKEIRRYQSSKELLIR